MSSTLGKELRKLRVDRDERLVDMAGKIGVSVAFLSAVETGRKSPPGSFAEKVITAYELGSTHARVLRDAAAKSRHLFKLAPRTPLARDTVALLARKLEHLPDERLAQIRRILSEDDGE
jgi:transcriptional regulator with XRE-family HTH domain